MIRFMFSASSEEDLHASDDDDDDDDDLLQHPNTSASAISPRPAARIILS